MAEKLIRIGRVSSVDTDNGMVSVTYPDMDGAVTDKFPLFSFTDEYKMPTIGSNVLVLHLSNGQSAGIAMGHFWNTSNKPHLPNEQTPEFRKELAALMGVASIIYNNETVTIHAKHIVLDGDVSITNGNVTVASGSVVVPGGEVTARNVSLTQHIHTDSVGGSTTKPT